MLSITRSRRIFYALLCSPIASANLLSHFSKNTVSSDLRWCQCGSGSVLRRLLILRPGRRRQKFRNADSGGHDIGTRKPVPRYSSDLSPRLAYLVAFEQLPNDVFQRLILSAKILDIAS